MANRVEQVNGTNVQRLIIEQFDGGMSERAAQDATALNTAWALDNAQFFLDGTVGKRPGNISLGSTGSGSKWDAIGCLQDPNNSGASNKLIVKSGGAIYAAAESAPPLVWSKISGATNFGNGTPMTFAQVYDPDFAPAAAKILVCCDGTQVPYGYDGTNFSPFATAHLPLGRTGAAITPSLVAEWGPHLVFSGEPTEPTAVYIMDPLRPERATGYGFTDSAGVTYTPYFPAGRDGSHGPVQAIAVIGNVLLVFYKNAIVAGINTGSYGALNYQWRFISNCIGTTSGRSVVQMDDYLIFFSGSRFYATQGSALYPLPDEIPTYYSYEAQSFFPPRLDLTNLVCVRYGQLYIASTPNGFGSLVFDVSAAGGYYLGSQMQDEPDSLRYGGAWTSWSGIDINCGVYLPVGGFNAPALYWGRYGSDEGGSYNPPSNQLSFCTDFGADITFQVLTRGFSLGAPSSVVTPLNVSAKIAFIGDGGPFTLSPSLRLGMDNTSDPLYLTPTNVTTGTYAVADVYPLPPFTAYPTTIQQGHFLQVAIYESSQYPIALQSFTVEAEVDAPRPTI